MKRTVALFAACLAAAFAVVRFVPAQAVCGAPIDTVSLATLTGQCIAANAVHWTLALLACAVLALFVRPASGAPVPAQTARADRLTFLLCACAALIAGFDFAIGGPLQDMFHEGEALAFGPAFASAQPFARTVLVHGFGVDVLPSLIARAVSPGAVIATSRLVRALEAAGFFAAFLWAFFELAAFDARTQRRVQLIAVALVVLLSFAGYGHELVRKTVAMAQFALLVRAVRTRDDRLWLLLGASAGIAVLYNYVEAFGVTLLAGVAVLALRRGRALLFALAGGLAAAIVLAVALGPSQVAAIASGLRLLARTAGATWMLPLGDDPAAVLLLFGPLVAVQAFGLVHARRRPELWLALGISLAGYRLWFERADDKHLALACISTLFLAVLLLAPALPAWLPGRRALRAALTVAAALAVFRAGSGVVQARTPDRAVVAPDVAAAVDAMAPEVRPASCFYTLTSEGAWYELFDKPACSRFHHVTYARTPASEREIVEALEREKPPAVLIENEFWSNHIDGIPVSVTNAIVMRYVLSRYRPGPAIGANWFWRRGKKPIGVEARFAGGTIRRIAPAGPGQIEVSGSVSSRADAVLVLDARSREPVAVARVDGAGNWQTRAPAGDVLAAVYDPAADALVPIAGAVAAAR